MINAMKALKILIIVISIFIILGLFLYWIGGGNFERNPLLVLTLILSTAAGAVTSALLYDLKYF